MFMHFEFKDGSNPYIAKTNKALFYMLTHYDCEQVEEDMFVVNGSYYQHHILTPFPYSMHRTYYETKKEQVIDIAIDWQNSFSNGISYHYSTLADWQGFFEEYGRRYGLLTEFRENGIC